ncbi:hypothetical protein MMC13_004714 [Lambiella insularis]|nr:hypothetical protein [Lambiella insularis]
MPGILKPEHIRRGTSMPNELDALPIARKFSKTIQSRSNGALDDDTMGFAKEYPHLMTSEAHKLSPQPSKRTPLRQSKTDDHKSSLITQSHKPKAEVYIRDFAICNSPALSATATNDQPGHKLDDKIAQVPAPANQSDSKTKAPLNEPRVFGGGQTRTGILEPDIDLRSSGDPSGTNQSRTLYHKSSSVSDPKEYPEPLLHPPVPCLGASVSKEIPLSAALPFDSQTMSAVPTSINVSSRPSPPPSKPLPPIPATHGALKPHAEANRAVAHNTPLPDHVPEPPIPLKSPARSKRNSLHIPNNEQAVPPIPTYTPAVTTQDPPLQPVPMTETVSEPPAPEPNQSPSLVEDAFSWRQKRKEKVQALKKRHLEASRTQQDDQKADDVITDNMSDSTPDSDDTIILPNVPTQRRPSHQMSSPRPQSPTSNRWSHLTEAAYGPPRRASTFSDPALQPAPLRTDARVPTTRPQYKHKTQGSLYIPPSPPLSAASSPVTEDIPREKLPTRASFRRHRSSRRFSTFIEPKDADTPQMSSSGDESASRLEAELAAEKKRNALLEKALLAMAEALAAVKEKGRPSPTAERRGGDAPLENALEAMISSFGGGGR